MNIYKLQYTDKSRRGDADLLAKGTYEVVTEEGVSQDVYRNGTQAIRLHRTDSRGARHV